ncbi:hypothetical protein PS627_01622 [Pseudomonas fluorescens]|uniref:anti-sigma factor n=1 Tax=Pseudomonas fluorescens TaxID=294 RepID=UPI001256C752|nr:anti-sigma factor [Pseudomonas fluorescens]CAG8865703.1 hypothetical protein PS627_01622 [Pseudomonas fluorescens]VVP87554.1 hypothetical protein PS910_02563 [Pseudomonas fluorescens]
MTTQAGPESPDDIDALAGEYVLGTLPLEQRREVRRRLGSDTRLRAAVDAWEQRLLGLTELAEPQTPPPRLWQRIERSLGEHQALDRPAPTQASSWWNPLALWRYLAGAGLLASVVLGALLLTRTTPPTSYLVVLVGPQDQAPGWVIQTSDARQIQLIPLGVAQVPTDKALEFWTKGEGWQGPVSLGLVKPGHTVTLDLDKLPPLEPNQLFELTLENANGSPTGRPTGPIQFIGRAVKVI